jgi:hypothetical protein
MPIEYARLTGKIEPQIQMPEYACLELYSSPSSLVVTLHDRSP